jgi:tetratricopeptide (TPR) repeat protein
MAKQTVITREELNRTEDDLDFAEVALFWLKQNANKIITVLAIIFAVYAGFALLNQRREAKRAEASNMLFSAYQDFDRGLLSPWASAERVTAMESARRKAEEIIKKFPGESVTRNALFLKANTYYFQGDLFGSAINTQQAIAVFQQYNDEAARSNDPMERAAAQLALGYAQENLSILMGQDEQQSRAALVAALNHYKTVEDQVGSAAGFLLYEAKNARARILATVGQRDEAIALYKEVLRSRHTEVPLPDETASQRARILYSLQMLAGQFTTGATARIQLQRLGVDLEALDKELGLTS